MLRRNFCYAVLMLLSVQLLSQNNMFTLSGGIRDKDSGEDILYGAVMVKGTSESTSSNEYGFYSLTLPEGTYTIQFSYMGYHSKEEIVELTQDTRLEVELISETTQIDEVVLTAERQDKNVTKNETGVVNMNIKEAKLVPVILGEQDVMKTMQLMPGVSSASETSSGFHVRGGSIGQNLITLDESPVYNASHLLGMFSIFNSDAIKDVKMYKAGIPAQYGGRASSVMDIRMKEGNMREYHTTGGIGLLSSRISMEGPIVEDQGSFIISGRRTYIDLFTPLVKSINAKLYFYDLNLKANYKFGEHDRVYLTAYLGKDHLGINKEFSFEWGNVNTSLRWNHVFTDKLFSNLSFITSDYNYAIGIEDLSNKITLSSGIRTYDLKHDFSFHMTPSTTSRFGYMSSFKTFAPGKYTNKSAPGTADTSKKIPESQVVESALYTSLEQKYGDWSVNYGLRYSIFNVLGGRDFHTYNPSGKRQSTVYHKSGKIVKTYHGLEPRLNLTYLLNKQRSIKASYNRMYQYIHLMSATSAGSPTDYWIPSSPNVKPQITDQFSIGYYENFLENSYEMSVETYYKKTTHAVAYRDLTSIMLNEHIEGDILSGDGRAYGVEFMVKKKQGDLTGWASYTLSRTEKKIDGINEGKWFLANYDKTHDITLVGMYKLSDHWSLSASWTFQTGRAVTFPAGVYDVDGIPVKEYTQRNSYRMDDFHKLDLGTIYTITDTKEFKSDLVLSLYNAYGRDNPYSITFSKNKTTGKNQAKQLTLFKFVPSITWNFKF